MDLSIEWIQHELTFLLCFFAFLQWFDSKGGGGAQEGGKAVWPWDGAIQSQLQAPYSPNEAPGLQKFHSSWLSFKLPNECQLAILTQHVARLLDIIRRAGKRPTLCHCNSGHHRSPQLAAGVVCAFLQVNYQEAEPWMKLISFSGPTSQLRAMLIK